MDITQIPTTQIPARRPIGWRAVLIAAVIAALAGGGIGVGGAYLLRPSSGCDATAVATNVLPSVVTVFATGENAAGSGSGVIISEDGLVLTNDHVIAPGATDGDIEVLLDSGQQVPASLVGRDPLTDLAVLDIDASHLRALPLASQVNLAIGQPVVALGAPLGLSGTVTAGIISSLNRSISVPKADGGTTVIMGAIQTDAAVNPGNSGGPLVTCRGQLIGINTAISTVPNSAGVAGGGSVGIGFAVPATTAERIVAQLVANGQATHPWIGAETTEISAKVAAAFGTSPGLFIQSVTAGGPADTAGLQRGDIVTTISGQRATTFVLARLLVTAAIGDQVHLTYLRGGAESDTTITLVEQPAG